jgi:hypothetical protein
MSDKSRDLSERRVARKFRRAAKGARFWDDAPLVIRDRPRAGRGARPAKGGV